MGCIRRPRHRDEHVFCYFDESGDFAFPGDRFDCYTQTAVVCPDSYLPEIASYVEGRRIRWGVDELHASELSAGQRLNVRRFIAASPLQLVVQATDTTLSSRTAIRAWKSRQAEALLENLSMYRQQRGQAPDVERALTALSKRSDLTTRISDAESAVRVDVMVRLRGAAVLPPKQGYGRRLGTHRPKGLIWPGRYSPETGGRAARCGRWHLRSRMNTAGPRVTAPAFSNTSRAATPPPRDRPADSEASPSACCWASAAGPSSPPRATGRATRLPVEGHELQPARQPIKLPRGCPLFSLTRGSQGSPADIVGHQRGWCLVFSAVRAVARSSFTARCSTR